MVLLLKCMKLKNGIKCIPFGYGLTLFRRFSNEPVPIDNSFVVEYSPQQIEAIQKDLNKINMDLFNKTTRKVTPGEIFATIDQCNVPLTKEFSKKPFLMTELNYPTGWDIAKTQKAGLFARTLYFKEPVLNWDRYDCIRYFADEAILSYFTVRRILTEVKNRMKDFRPKTMLDFGAGPGSATVAAKEVFESSLKTVNAVENNIDMIQLGKIFTADEKVNIFWHKTIDKENLKQHDVSVAAFVLSEITEEKEREALLEKLWKSTKKILILVEGGEPKGSKVVTKARDYLLKSHPPSIIAATEGASVIAPCPHDAECPLNKYAKRKTTWCHFAQRIPTHNIPKNSVLYTDPKSPIKRFRKTSAEKPETRNVFEHIFRFSYVVLSKGASLRKKNETLKISQTLRGGFSQKTAAAGSVEEQALTWPRLVEAPKKNKGHVALRLCDEKGDFRSRVVTRSFGPSEFAQARKAQWGDLWPYEEKTVVTEKTGHRLKFKKLKEQRKLLVKAGLEREKKMAEIGMGERAKHPLDELGEE